MNEKQAKRLRRYIKQQDNDATAQDYKNLKRQFKNGLFTISLDDPKDKTGRVNLVWR